MAATARHELSGTCTMARPGIPRGTCQAVLSELEFQPVSLTFLTSPHLASEHYASLGLISTSAARYQAGFCVLCAPYLADWRVFEVHARTLRVVQGCDHVFTWKPASDPQPPEDHIRTMDIKFFYYGRFEGGSKLRHRVPDLNHSAKSQNIL